MVWWMMFLMFYLGVGTVSSLAWYIKLLIARAELPIQTYLAGVLLVIVWLPVWLVAVVLGAKNAIMLIGGDDK